ncbi:4Fe-4S binding protein [Kitasatospora sp. NPDC051853]|uniref:4Fe-4S binding protein n=1 Tax=Kitasatospora sp. NPDC051853 TaxID=3364058 RepID=UPI00378EC865
MAYAITRSCCNDATCVAVCPVNCIHPTPDEPDFGRTDLLYIDPEACIDCGACADACPVEAIRPTDELTGPDTVFIELNRRYYEENPTDHAWGAPSFPRSLPARAEPLRIAIVGTGPAASYTAQELLRSTDAQLTVLDRRSVSGGLLRLGVAPDHTTTRRISDHFAQVYRHPRLRLHLSTEIGRHLSHAELAAHHHAVVYATGAEGDRRLGLPGEELPGSLSATTVVGWYNGDPAVPADAVPLTAEHTAHAAHTPHAERVVIVGNGNVALDITRVLLQDPDGLAGTEIAAHALAALRSSRVREVVLLARRGPEDAAWTAPEFLALRELPGVEVVLTDDPATLATVAAALPGEKAALLAGLPVVPADAPPPPAGTRRITLRFHTTPVGLTGGQRVEGIEVRATGTPDGPATTVPAGLVIRSIGHHGTPVPGLPHDERTGTLPNELGRVTDPATGRPLPGTYVVGWAKRGPVGGIGSNRGCAQETVAALLDDAAARTLPSPSGTGTDFGRLLRRRARR